MYDTISEGNSAFQVRLNLTGYLTEVVRHATQLIGNCALSSRYPELCVW